jgi:ABC-type branched-subunit amino acid transport system ATPase component
LTDRNTLTIAEHEQPKSGILPHRPDRPPLVAVRGLRKSFGGLLLFENIDVDLAGGEVVLLRGDNGSGKTTLLNILTGNVEPDAGEIRYAAAAPSQVHRFPRRWFESYNPHTQFSAEAVVRSGICRTWQELRLFDSLTLRDNIAVAAPNNGGERLLPALLGTRRFGATEQRIRKEANSLLETVGLTGRETSSADRISLGQAKRVALARAVATGATVLFLDEPFSGLDQDGILATVALLQSLVRDRHLTLVVVEHVFNHPHLRELVTTEWLLRDGHLLRCNVRDQGDAGSNVAVSDRPAWLRSSERPLRLESLPRGAVITRVALDAQPLNRDPLLEVRDLIVRRGARVVVGRADDGKTLGLNLTLYDGELAILQAPNGWGKSTLLAAICGIIPVDAGEIRFRGTSIHHLPVWKRVRLGIGALPSHAHSFDNLTVDEVLELAGVSDRAAKAGSLTRRLCSSLSGGERQRIALRSLAPASLQLIDEPFSNLDSDGADEAASLLSGRYFQSVFLAIPRTNI